LQFKQINGQLGIRKKLIKTVHDNRVSHAQLFYGPEGSRKLAIALAYAQFINCKNRHFDADGNGDSCGICPSCIKYEKLIHPDLHFIYPVARTKEVDKDPMSKDFIKTWRQILLENDYRLSLNDWYAVAGFEKKQGIINADDCSDILRTLSYKSYESEFKVMIIWMADRLFHAAAPKILKILEEPPEKSLFILITENPEKIISTILSRTQMVKFPKLFDEDIIKELDDLSCPREDANRIVPLADGNLTRAVRIFKKEEEELDYLDKFVRWMRLCYDLYNKNKLKETLEFTAEMAKIGRERQKNFLAYAERIIRNAMLINYNNPQLARLNEDEKEFVKKFGPFINYVNIPDFATELEKAQYHIERNANPNILFMDLSLTFTILLMSAAKTVKQK
jgi:DNA polymerase III subunit delta'